MKQVERLLNFLKIDKRTITFDLTKVGKKIGDGIDGTVFNYGKNKVIKIIRFPKTSGYIKFQQYIKTLNNNVNIVKIFTHGELKIKKSKKKTYWILMEKLYPLHSKYEYFLDEIHYGTNFTLKTLGKRGFAFQKGFRNLPLPYYDLYIHNVMKNKHGTWKLIDLEGFNESISATT